MTKYSVVVMAGLLSLTIGCAKPQVVTRPLGNIQVKPATPGQPAGPAERVMTNVLVEDNLASTLHLDTGNSCVQWVQTQDADMLYFEAGYGGCGTQDPPLPNPASVKFKLTLGVPTNVGTPDMTFPIIAFDGSTVGTAYWGTQVLYINHLCDTHDYQCLAIVDDSGAWHSLLPKSLLNVILTF